jgi:hypothetical protein
VIRRGRLSPPPQSTIIEGLEMSAYSPKLTFGGDPLPDPRFGGGRALTFGGSGDGSVSSYLNRLPFSFGAAVPRTSIEDGDPRRGTFATGASQNQAVIRAQSVDGRTDWVNSLTGLTQGILAANGAQGDVPGYTPVSYPGGQGGGMSLDWRIIAAVAVVGAGVYYAARG